MILKIEKLIYGGYGLARADEKVVFVKGGIPGDEVEVEITEKRKSFDIGNISKFIKTSRHRVKPECNYFGKCGGCHWQNIEYDIQLKTKEAILLESLARIGGIKNINMEPIVSSESSYHYRNRVTIHLDTQNGKHVIGFKEEKSHELVPIDECPISVTNVSNLVERISRILNSLKFDTLPFEKIFISDSGSTQSISITPSRNVPVREIKKLFYKIKEYLQDVDISFVNKNEKSFDFKVMGLNYVSCPSVFSQANSDINEKLIKTLIDWAELEMYYKVIDLYCGYGNFSLQIAKKVRNVTGIDNNSKAIKFARKNAKLNFIKNCNFESHDVNKYLERYNSGEKTDLIIIDPPRKGAKGIIESLIEIKATKIIYISCNPTTLARDIKELIKGGYSLKKVRAFDMFPQTYHLESLAMLEA